MRPGSQLRFRVAATFPLALALAAAAVAQVLPFELITSRQGLPQSQVATVAQDSEGYIWVGTAEGLGRYNGTSFTTYSREEGLGNSRIWELLLTRDGTLYAATGGGVSYWRDHRMQNLAVPGLQAVRCHAIAEDASGNVWIGSDNGVYFGRGTTFRQVTSSGTSTDERVYDLLPDQGTILVVSTTGLWRIDDQGRRTAVPGPPIRPDNYRCIALTQDGLWLGSYAQGLWLLGADGWRRIPPDQVAGDSFWRMETGPSGTFYVSSNGNGLFLRRPGSSTFENWNESHGLPSNIVNCAFEDRERNLWIGTDIGGLARLGGKAVSNHGKEQGLPSECVFGITAGDTEDSLWLGTMRGAVHYQVRPHPRVLEVLGASEGLANDQVWKLRRTPDGILWVLSDTALQFRRQGGSRLEGLPAEVPLPRSNPYDIEVDAQGRLWAAGVDDECALSVRSASGSWTAIPTDEQGQPLARIQRLCRRLQGGVWLASDMELKYCDGSAVHALPDSPLPASSNYGALLEDSRGRLWVGSESGLAVWSPDGRWQSMNDRPGFTHRHVFFIGEDRESRIWVGTTHGVFVFTDQGPVQPFNTEDGLAEPETNQNGFFCDSRGEIWIGTVNGMSQYDQANLRPNVTPPMLMVEQALFSDQVVQFPTSLDLSWADRNITFQVAVLSFRNRARTSYQYWMDGLEDGWQAPVQGPVLRYTNLPPGRLTLRLKAVNESGTGSEERDLAVVVHPPFYMTGWFQGLALALALASGLGVHRWRTSILKRRNQELEETVAKRTEDLRSANAQLSHMATHEPLTGLFNRRAITDRMASELQPGGRPNRQFGVILVDLNKFKPVNDTLGHSTGDLVLREMATRIHGCLRDSDVLGRWGGDEFLVVLPGSDWDAVASVCRRISQLEYPASGEAGTIVVTASCGGVAVPGRTEANPAAVLAAADDLMYKVKRAGGRGFEVRVFETIPERAGDATGMATGVKTTAPDGAESSDS